MGTPGADSTGRGGGGAGGGAATDLGGSRSRRWCPISAQINCQTCQTLGRWSCACTWSCAR